MIWLMNDLYEWKSGILTEFSVTLNINMYLQHINLQMCNWTSNKLKNISKVFVFLFFYFLGGYSTHSFGFNMVFFLLTNGDKNILSTFSHVSLMKGTDTYWKHISCAHQSSWGASNTWGREIPDLLQNGGTYFSCVGAR